MATKYGQFTQYKARLTKHGDAEYSAKGSVASVKDEYTVLMPDNETLPTVKNVQGLPAMDAEHSTYKGVYVSDINFSQVNPGSPLWTVSVEYQRRVYSSGSASTSKQTITALDWGTVTHQVEFTTDQVTGKPVQNSATDVFDTVPQVEISDQYVHITRLERKLDFAKLALNGKVNDADVSICGMKFKKHCGRVTVKVQDTLDSEGHGYRYSYDYTITGRSNIAEIDGTKKDIGWDVAIVDCGFRVLEGNELVKVVVLDENNNETEPSLPVRLDGHGHKQSDTGETVVLKFSPYAEGDFKTLELPAKAP